MTPASLFVTKALASLENDKVARAPRIEQMQRGLTTFASPIAPELLTSLHDELERFAFQGLLDSYLLPQSIAQLTTLIAARYPPGQAAVHGAFRGLATALMQVGWVVTCVDDDGTGVPHLWRCPEAAGFDLVAVDLLRHPHRPVGALRGAAAALGPAGRLLTFGHVMQRDHAERDEAAGLVLAERFCEVAARVHVGDVLDPFYWDVELYSRSPSGLGAEEEDLLDTEDLEPVEKSPGGIDIRGFARPFTDEGVRYAEQLFCDAGMFSVRSVQRDDRAPAWCRHFYLADGTVLTWMFDGHEGRVSVDATPWSPALLYLSANVIRLANRFDAATGEPL